MIYKDKSTADKRVFWECVERIADEVKNWPEWKKGQAQNEQPQHHEIKESESSNEGRDLR